MLMRSSMCLCTIWKMLANKVKCMPHDAQICLLPKVLSRFSAIRCHTRSPQTFQNAMGNLQPSETMHAVCVGLGFCLGGSRVHATVSGSMRLWTEALSRTASPFHMLPAVKC